jgi:hypothetical protein
MKFEKPERPLGLFRSATNPTRHRANRHRRATHASFGDEAIDRGALVSNQPADENERGAKALHSPSRKRLGGNPQLSRQRFRLKQFLRHVRS